MKTQTKHRKIFVLLICIVLAILLSGYTVVAGVRVITDNRLKSGGDVFWTEGVEDFNIFEDLRPPFGGEAIIKPGVEGTYSFVVENRGEAPMTVYFRLFDENAYQIPMEYRLKTGDQYLMGNESTWEDSAHLDKYEVKDTLQENTRREYKLDWSWADNRGAESDARDTWIGDQAAAGADVTYTLQMELRAETDIEDLDKPTDPEEPDKPTDPDEPDKPTDPEKPDEPDKPIDPEKPDEPDKPIDPEKPDEPDKPIDPENPDEPNKPIDPENPEDPDEPNKPTEPEQPNEEEQLHVPENGGAANEESAEGVQQVVVEAAKTGDHTYLWLYTGLAIAAAGSFLLILLWKKRKSEEDETK